MESVESLDEFQALLFSLTMVPPDRQKIMCKGKMIKDSPAVAALKEGDKLVLMGTADAPPKAPEKAVVFEEDLTDAQKVGVVKDLLSAGLHNLGNTSVPHRRYSAPAAVALCLRAHCGLQWALTHSRILPLVRVCVCAFSAATWRRLCSACAPCPSSNRHSLRPFHTEPVAQRTERPGSLREHCLLLACTHCDYYACCLSDAARASVPSPPSTIRITPSFVSSALSTARWTARHRPLLR